MVILKFEKDQKKTDLDSQREPIWVHLLQQVGELSCSRFACVGGPYNGSFIFIVRLLDNLNSKIVTIYLHLRKWIFLSPNGIYYSEYQKCW